MTSVPTQQIFRFIGLLMVFFYNFCVYPLCTAQRATNAHAQCLIIRTRFYQVEKPLSHRHRLKPLHHRLHFHNTLMELYIRISALNLNVHNVLAHNICMGHKRDTSSLKEDAITRRAKWLLMIMRRERMTSGKSTAGRRPLAAGSGMSTARSWLLVDGSSFFKYCFS